MDNQIKYLILFKNISTLVQGNPQFVTLTHLNQLQITYNVDLAVGFDYKIAQIGNISQHTAKTVVDCSGTSIIPGLVDCHTHALFYGDRSKQFSMKIQGKKYLQIYQAGLGIRYTTKCIKEASEKQLIDHLLKYVKKMSKLGTTLVEIKSGYGLDTQNQLKMLKVIEQVKKLQVQVDIVSTYCGAHSIPLGKNQQQQTKDIIQNQIPAIKKAIQEKIISPQFIDVFCQKNIFEIQSTKKILLAGQSINLKPNFHAQQLNHLGSSLLAAQLKATAVSHLEHLDDQGIYSLSKQKVVGILLPTTQHIQKLKLPPVRKMIDQGMIISLGSDFSPNAHCYSLPLTMHLACINYKLSVNQALNAATINSAHCLKRSKQYGSLHIGKWADFIILDNVNWQHIIYEFGDLPIKHVVKKGCILN